MPKLKVIIRPYPGDYSIINNTITINNHTFTFNTILHKTEQKNVYKELSTLTDDFLGGKNANIFAYGQTGSGKSYTMGLNCNEEGIVQFALKDIFNKILLEQQNFNKNLDPAYAEKSINSEECINYVTISMLEIYNEEVFDLLNNKAHLLLRFNTNLVITGLTEKKVSDYEEAVTFLNLGLKNRLTKKTAMNDTSSRSHGIILLSYYKNNTLISKYSFIDLAGSERIKKSLVTGIEKKESICINKSLLALCNCINLLSQNKYHIPYRQSKLTRILQYALEGDCSTVMVVCINGNNFESYDALNYASRAMNIQTECHKKVVYKNDINALIIENNKLIEENKKLKEENKKLQLIINSFNNSVNYNENINNINDLLMTDINKGINNITLKDCNKLINENTNDNTIINNNKSNNVDINNNKGNHIDNNINNNSINNNTNNVNDINNTMINNISNTMINNKDNIRNKKRVSFSNKNEYKFFTPKKRKMTFLERINKKE